MALGLREVHWEPSLEEEMRSKKGLREKRSRENEEEEADKGLSLDRLLNTDATWQMR